MLAGNSRRVIYASALNFLLTFILSPRRRLPLSGSPLVFLAQKVGLGELSALGTWSANNVSSALRGTVGDALGLPRLWAPKCADELTLRSACHFFLNNKLGWRPRQPSSGVKDRRTPEGLHIRRRCH